MKLLGLEANHTWVVASHPASASVIGSVFTPSKSNPMGVWTGIELAWSPKVLNKSMTVTMRIPPSCKNDYG